MKHFILVALVALGAWRGAVAAPLDFPEQNCTITFPENWTIAKTPPRQTIVAGLSNDRTKTVALIVMIIQPGDEALAAPHMNDSLKEYMGRDGQAVVEGAKTIGGMSFHTFAGRMGAKTSLMAYTTSAGGRLYMIQTSSSSDIAGADADILSVVSSFRLLNTTGGASAGRTPDSAADRLGYAIGIITGIVLIVVVVAWWINKLRK